MTIVVKLGGTNGSGKTSVARELIKVMKMNPTIRKVNSSKISGYVGGKPVWAVLGSYENVCGGMDTISDKEERLNLVRASSESGLHKVVFFEGLITGKTYGAFGAMSEEPEHKGRWLYAFMDTPFDVCVERVMARRAARGNAAPFNAERTMRPTFKSVQATALKAQKQGHKVLWLPHNHTPALIAMQLIKAVNTFNKELNNAY